MSNLCANETKENLWRASNSKKKSDKDLIKAMLDGKISKVEIIKLDIKEENNNILNCKYLSYITIS